MNIKLYHVSDFFKDKKYFWPLEWESATSLTAILRDNIYYSNLEEFLEEYDLIDQEEDYYTIELDGKMNELSIDEKILFVFKDWDFSIILLSALFFQCLTPGGVLPNSGIDQSIWCDVIDGILYSPYGEIVFAAFKEVNFFNLSKSTFKDSLCFYFRCIFVEKLKKNKLPQKKNFILFLQTLNVEEEAITTALYQIYTEKNLTLIEYYFTKFLDESEGKTYE